MTNNNSFAADIVQHKGGKQCRLGTKWNCSAGGLCRQKGVMYFVRDFMSRNRYRLIIIIRL